MNGAGMKDTLLSFITEHLCGNQSSIGCKSAIIIFASLIHLIKLKLAKAYLFSNSEFVEAWNTKIARIFSGKRILTWLL